MLGLDAAISSISNAPFAFLSSEEQPRAYLCALTLVSQELKSERDSLCEKESKRPLKEMCPVG